jgi:hypothetical protein
MHQDCFQLAVADVAMQLGNAWASQGADIAKRKVLLFSEWDFGNATVSHGILDFWR